MPVPGGHGDGDNHVAKAGGAGLDQNPVRRRPAPYSAGRRRDELASAMAA